MTQDTMMDDKYATHDKCRRCGCPLFNSQCSDGRIHCCCRIRELTEHRDRLLEVCQRARNWMTGFMEGEEGKQVLDALDDAIAACEDKP